ncbi:hypothetical protein BDZ89DRAFT_950940 [Hymenopellis radicata]|nr:hypothetical protein BDZ89DRAFT_950940 [Hymenopellis radicata]
MRPGSRGGSFLLPFTTMMMKSALFFAALSALASLSLVRSATVDVYAPAITSPTNGTVWTVGEEALVTWDTSDAPAQITNKYGEVHLRLNGVTNMTALAAGFKILDGNVTIEVPDVEEAENYVVVLYGDSGNWSKEFTITGTA